MAVTIESGTLHEHVSGLAYAEGVRLLEYCAAEVLKFADAAPDAVHNEAVIRLAGYLAETPRSKTRNALTLSGAAAALLPYRKHNVRIVK